MGLYEQNNLEVTALCYNLQTSFYTCIIDLNILAYMFFFNKKRMIHMLFSIFYIVIIFPCQ